MKTRKCSIYFVVGDKEFMLTVPLKSATIESIFAEISESVSRHVDNGAILRLISFFEEEKK